MQSKPLADGALKAAKHAHRRDEGRLRGRHALLAKALLLGARCSARRWAAARSRDVVHNAQKAAAVGC